MKLIAKQDFMHGGRFIQKGQELEVSKVVGSSLIEVGLVQPIEKKKSKKKNAIKSAEG